MNSCIACPKCNCLAHFNSHFGAYFCTKCEWFDDSYNKNRIKNNNKGRNSKMDEFYCDICDEPEDMDELSQGFGLNICTKCSEDIKCVLQSLVFKLRYEREVTK